MHFRVLWQLKCCLIGGVLMGYVTVSVFDVAVHILKELGAMSAMKLQKLIFYSQAWSLVWDDKPLFDEEIEAWANGPVVRALYDKHKGHFEVDSNLFNQYSKKKLGIVQQETVKVVLDFYGKKSAQWLSDQTHSELPWLDARRGISDNERSSEVITLESMAEYYGSL
jgi:uncharacterized phage-associated protein